MHRNLSDAKGFGAIGVLIIVVVLVVVGGAGALVYHQYHKTKATASSSSSAASTKATTSTTKTTTTPDPYVGWKTYTVGSTGLSFRYPADWTVSDNPQCGGAHGYSVDAPTSELVGISPVGEALTSYSLGVIVNPAPATATCGGSLASDEGIAVGAQSQNQAITSGVLKGKYVLVNGNTTDGVSGVYVLNKSYSAGQKIGETGLLTVNGESLDMGAGFMAGQEAGHAGTSSFLSSQLYKDTVSIFDSFTAQ